MKPSQSKALLTFWSSQIAFKGNVAGMGEEFCWVGEGSNPLKYSCLLTDDLPEASTAVPLKSLITFVGVICVLEYETDKCFITLVPDDNLPEDVYWNAQMEGLGKMIDAIPEIGGVAKFSLYRQPKGALKFKVNYKDIDNKWVSGKFSYLFSDYICRRNS